MGAAMPAQLSGEEILALKFAAHRQLARWAKRPTLGSRQHAQRNALKRAVHVLQTRRSRMAASYALPSVEQTGDARRLAQDRSRPLRIL